MYWAWSYNPTIFLAGLKYLLLFQVLKPLQCNLYSKYSIQNIQRILNIFSCFRFTSLSSAIYIVPVVIFTLLWNIPHFTELNTCYRVIFSFSLNIDFISLRSLHITQHMLQGIFLFSLNVDFIPWKITTHNSTPAKGNWISP